MKIDAFTHFMPAEYAQRLSALGDTPAANSIRNRIAHIPAIVDLDVRLAQLEEFGDDYRQIISLPAPPLEDIGPRELGRDMARIANDGQAQLCADHPERFAGWVAAVPLADVDDAVEEARRAVGELGAAGVQVYTNVGGHPWDEPRFATFWEAIAELDAMCWVHPSRNQLWADYPTEDVSRYEIWWTLGWPHETALFMARMVFSGVFDRHPDLKVLTHHGGGTVAHLAGRLAGGWDQLGARTPADQKELVATELRERPVDAFKHFYVDTALFGAPEAIRTSLDFFGVDHMLFASDSPFDPEKGPGYIRTTIGDLDGLGLESDVLEAIYHGNAERLLPLAVGA